MKRELKVQYHTLGCKLNFAETSAIGRLMAERGARTAAEGEVPDVVVVNTCSVTEVADTKGRHLIASLHRRYPQARIMVTGCYAQLKADEVAALPGVTLVAGSNDKLLLAQHLDEIMDPDCCREHSCLSTLHPSLFTDFMPSCERGDRTRAWLKVQDGCDYWCSYCTIPRARGRSRSGDLELLVSQARRAASEGAREIVLTGVNIGCWGKERGEKLITLLEALDRLESIDRYRIGSVEPDLLTDDIIDFVARSRRFMPHFHLPLQCGSDEVLRLMRRHYDTALFADRIQRVRQSIPDAFIGVDLIVGMRGETAQLFEQSRQLVEALDLTHLHVFPYSERPGTRALEIQPSVSAMEKARRAKVMGDISLRKHVAFAQKHIGQTRPVLMEARGAGFTDNYLRVHCQGRAEENTIVNVRLTGVNPQDGSMTGVIV